MYRIVLILFIQPLFILNSCCVNELNNVSDHHTVYDCGNKSTLISSDAIKEISIQIKPSLHKQLKQISREYDFDEIELVMVFEIKSDSGVDLLSSTYKAYMANNEVFNDQTESKSIERINKSLSTSNCNLIHSEFEPGQVYSIRYKYNSRK